ncbi:MAG: hypothetical protein RLZZ324_1334 [Candidatus Parcubacteria bacterium]|jgi:hypothetical protein
MHVKKKLITSIAIIALLDLALVGAVAVPAILSIEDSQTQIVTLQRDLDAQYSLRLFMRDAAGKLAANHTRIAGLNKAAVREGRELEFITAFEQIEAANGVQQELNLQTANQKLLTPWEKNIPLTVTISGPFPNVLRELNAIERLPYAVTIASVSMSGTGGIVKADVSGSAYWIGRNAPAFVDGGSTTKNQP